MTKRKKFVLVSSILTFGLIGLQFIPLDRRYEAIIFFSGVSVLLSLWSLYSDLKGINWLTAMILPALYPASVGLFYFLLPVNIFSRTVLLSLFGIGMYALLLTENIYAVAASRTIQLVRAAHAVGFLLTVITAVFLIGTLFGLRLSYLANGIMVMVILWPLFIKGLWSSTIQKNISGTIWMYSAVLALVGGEIAMFTAFLPMTSLVAAILVSGYLYVTLGLMQQHLQERLFSKTIQEYVWVGIIVFLAALLVTYR
ncbi:hypothetical protein HZB78_04535 [Candidatus Collierbacteria bacterium]|nr:hypothetical protein [Candidatus Collierbacteria bacterium]